MNRITVQVPAFRVRIPPGHGKRTILWTAIAVLSVSIFSLLGSGLWIDSLRLGGRGATEDGIRPGSAEAVAGPTVNSASFRRQGRLAFVWNGRLYLLDGEHRSVKLLARRGASSPALSSDGTRVAHLEHVMPGGGARLWIRSADGKAAAQITDLPSELGAFAWSPTSPVLAIVSGGPEGKAGQVWLVRPGEPSQRIATAPAPISGLAWRPDGRALAYAAADGLFLLDGDPGMRAGGPRRVFVAENEGIELAAWWPDGRGLLFWRNPERSASLAADGLDLFSLRLGDAAATKLATTLTYPEWISWAPDGRRVLLVAGSGRESSDHKSLAMCDVSSGTCTALPQPPGTVSLDPAWSPSGDRISFVRAARREGLAGPWDRWMGTRRLWTASPDGSEGRQVATKGAVIASGWSKDARHILFVGGGSLWLANPAGGAPLKVVSPFPGPDGSVTGGGFYYGFFPLDTLVSWWRG